MDAEDRATIWRALGKLARNRKKDCRSGDTIPNSEKLSMVSPELWGKNDELTPDFFAELWGKNDELTPDFFSGSQQTHAVRADHRCLLRKIGNKGHLLSASEFALYTYRSFKYVYGFANKKPRSTQ